MTYLGFLAIVLFFLAIAYKDHKRFKTEKYDAFCRGFLAGIEMDESKAPRSYTGTEDFPASATDLQINKYWRSGRTTYFDWYSTTLYKTAYSDGYRMGQIDAANNTTANKV